MTKEQIAQLEKLEGAGVGGLSRPEFAARWHLPRLLEERKRLLEALRPFTEGAGAITYRKMMYEYGMEHVVKQTDAALAAVKFAEAPAH